MSEPHCVEQAIMRRALLVVAARGDRLIYRAVLRCYRGDGGVRFGRHVPIAGPRGVLP